MESSGLPESRRCTWEAKAARIHRVVSLRREGRWVGRERREGGRERMGRRKKERKIESKQA